MDQIVAEVKRQLPDVGVEVTDRFNFEYAEVSVRLIDPSGAKLHAAIAYDFYNEPELWQALLPMQVGYWKEEMARIKEDPTCWSCHCHNPALVDGAELWA
jgi:predicted dithiol-disulfide oxidoreductase (DUF899 family)